MITRRAKINSKNEQLQIILDSDEHQSIPIEDINSLMIENEQVQISSHA
jgi:CRISPR/Cas system-associated endonuclease Cas1